MRAGDVVGAAMADNNLAEILTLQFRLDPAEELLRNARRVCERRTTRTARWRTISGLSRVAAWRGDSGRGARAAVDGTRRLPRAWRRTTTSSTRWCVSSRSTCSPVTRRPRSPAADAAAAMLSQARRGAGRARHAWPGSGHGRCSTWAASTKRVESFERALSLATDDGFAYEIALSSLMLGRLRGDERAGRNERWSSSDELGVPDVPPGC